MDLLLEIARCPIVAHCLSGATDHPCSKVVASQGVSTVAEFQSPEPWSGHLAEAPILFLSSNPSIGITSRHQYPRATWEEGAIADYFEYRFGGSPLTSVEQGIYDALPGEMRSTKATATWKGVRARAGELLQRRSVDVAAGRDYVLTEVVHCKSTSELGVKEALSTCADRYLEPVLRSSTAKVIVVLGSQAGNKIRRRWHLEAGKSLLGPVELGGQMRMITFLPHPTSWEKRTVRGVLGDQGLRDLQQWLLG